MKKQPDLSARELRARDFEVARRDVEVRVDSAISRIDAGAPQAAVDDADTLIGEGGKRVEALALGCMYCDLQGAIRRCVEFCRPRDGTRHLESQR